MHLQLALGGVDEVDATRPITIGSLTLGEEAATMAAALLAGNEQAPVATLIARTFRRPVYWSIDHAINGHAEIFGFPAEWKEALPTAIEVAIVKAVSALPPDQHSNVLAGGSEIILGSQDACADFRSLILAAENPMVGDTTAFDQATTAVITPRDGRGLKVAMGCLLNSYGTTPLKFRFLELYRVLEALFLADVKNRLISHFDTEPSSPLKDALQALQSELKQITALAERHKEIFEECWLSIDSLKVQNRFANALFRNLKKKKVQQEGKWQTGAALIYQIRCAVVHAGEKDMIFENFLDGDEAIEAILPPLERVALKMLGIELG